MSKLLALGQKPGLRQRRGLQAQKTEMVGRLPDGKRGRGETQIRGMKKGILRPLRTRVIVTVSSTWEGLS